jgi:hypothetical protein
MPKPDATIVQWLRGGQLETLHGSTAIARWLGNDGTRIWKGDQI